MPLFRTRLTAAQELDAVLERLQARGVAKFKGLGLEVEFDERGQQAGSERLFEEAAMAARPALTQGRDKPSERLPTDDEMLYGVDGFGLGPAGGA